MFKRLKKHLINLIDKNTLIYFLLHPIVKTYVVLRTILISDEQFILNQFKNIHGYALSINNPQTLNEKIQWLKLNDRSELHTICADKIAVRDFVKNKIGEEFLIPLLFTTDNIKSIKAENLPDSPVIIKTNHNSGGTFIVMDKNQTNWAKKRFDIKKSLQQNFYHYSREWQYKNIRPCILVEKLLIDSNGELPFDFKIHCFNGTAHFIQVDIDRFIDHKRNFYSTTWDLMPFTWCQFKNNSPSWPNGIPVNKPKELEHMLEIAEKLAHGFYYARIDLYTLNDKIYFGEITFHHGGGFELFDPLEWDLKLGKNIKLPINE